MLGTPPALILSQDQTLHKISLSVYTDFKLLILSCPAHKLLCLFHLQISFETYKLFSNYLIFKVLCQVLRSLFLDSSHSIQQKKSFVKGFLKKILKNFSKTPYSPSIGLLVGDIYFFWLSAFIFDYNHKFFFLNQHHPYPSSIMRRACYSVPAGTLYSGLSSLTLL